MKGHTAAYRSAIIIGLHLISRHKLNNVHGEESFQEFLHCAPAYSLISELSKIKKVRYRIGIGGVVGLMLPLALAAAVRVPYTTSPCSDLGQVVLVNLSLSVA